MDSQSSGTDRTDRTDRIGGNDRSAEEIAPRLGGMLHRRRLLAGSLATGVIAVGALRIAGAQDDSATPDATLDATPTAGQDETVVDANNQVLAEEMLARADDIILSVQTDRNSVTSGGDLSGVDAILAQASAHRDLARQALDAETVTEAVRQAVVAGATARAARVLLEARLSYPGLPSQEIRSSRELARAHEHIAAASTNAASASATGTNVDFFIANAQDLYTSAYDLYGTSAFAQASRTAQAASALARIADLLMVDDLGLGNGVMARGGPGRAGHPGHSGMRPLPVLPGLPGLDDDAMEGEEPVTVPAPEF